MPCVNFFSRETSIKFFSDAVRETKVPQSLQVVSIFANAATYQAQRGTRQDGLIDTF
jgi:hypothetical protein